MLVMKFGGTSVQDASALARVVAIIAQHLDEAGGLVVVLSATSGTTNDLLALARLAGSGCDIEALADGLALRHQSILADLAPAAKPAELLALLNEMRQYARALGILGECSDQSLDQMASFGERMSTTILHSALESRGHASILLDVRSVVRTDATFCFARVDMEKTRLLCTEHLAPLCTTGSVVVTQGFLGATLDARTTTLGRGGSDYSGAILGAMMGAREIQIWTDVSGVYSADPRIIPQAKPIPELSFAEVRGLALYGASVLHPDAIVPAMDADIPVRVVNTFKPLDPGTLIVARSDSSAKIHAVSYISACTLVQCSAKIASHFSSIPTVARNIILASSSIESTAVVICTSEQETSIALDVALTHVPNTLTRVAVLAVSGPAVASASVLSEITSKLPALGLKATITGVAPSMAFFVIDELQLAEALHAIHALIDSH